MKPEFIAIFASLFAVLMSLTVVFAVQAKAKKGGQ